MSTRFTFVALLLTGTAPVSDDVLRGAGATAFGPPASTPNDHHGPLAWFQVSGRFTQENHEPQGEFVIDVPRSEVRFIGRTFDALTVRGPRADLRGSGRLERREGTYSYLVTAIDGGGSAGSDRIRIKIWNGPNVLLDTDPGLAETAEPTRSLDLGRIVVRSDPWWWRRRPIASRP
jgi:hypothetical protein